MTRISGAELKARLAAFTRDVGFDSCRIAACNAPVHTTEFRDWLRQHAHGEMDYMQRGEEKRCDPQKVLPGARSIIVLALNYFQGHAGHSAAAIGKMGRIARYAWGDDYHDVIATKLSKIVRQKEEGLRDAVEAMATGQIAKGVDLLSEQNRIQSIEHRGERFIVEADDPVDH